MREMILEEIIGVLKELFLKSIEIKVIDFDRTL
ncbi:hypothetical protein HMPREF9017_01533 [Parascardovia denticolens F0305]|nr:hypothetical protein HMPREF9017_01533 [Parascardovia denticolens F0305]